MHNSQPKFKKINPNAKDDGAQEPSFLASAKIDDSNQKVST